MDEEFKIACVPCLDGMKMGYVPYKNSVISKCCKCNTSIWVGPECWKKHKEEGIELWCMVCLAKEMGPEEVAASMKSLTNKGMGE